MTEFRDFDQAAANNTGASSAGFFAELMDYDEVNNAAREFQAILARWRDDNNGSIVTTGSAGAYVFSAAQTLTSLAAGDTFKFEANHSNTGAASLNVDSIGAVAIVRQNGSALVGGEIVSGGVYEVVHDGTNFQLMSPSAITDNLSAADGNFIVGDGTTFVAESGATARASLGLGSLAVASTISDSDWSGTDLSIANGGTGSSTAADARVALGLEIGVNVQAADADLTAIAALANTDGNFIVGSGSGWVAESGADARTSLGLGSLATLSTINDSNWSGTDLAVANGGTGSSTASGARTNLGLGTMATRNVTVSTSAPSGGSNNDLWFVREA